MPQHPTFVDLDALSRPSAKHPFLICSNICKLSSMLRCLQGLGCLLVFFSEKDKLIEGGIGCNTPRATCNLFPLWNLESLTPQKICRDIARSNFQDFSLIFEMNTKQMNKNNFTFTFPPRCTIWKETHSRKSLQKVNSRPL